MTTPAAEALYLAQHRYEHEGKSYTMFNPNNIPIEELPIIYGFNNGGSRGWLSAIALAADGEVLGGHICSDEGYMEYDLGILEGTRPDRHKNDYQKHYPEGYRMVFVPTAEIKHCGGLQRAISLANAKEHAEKESGSPG